MSLRASAHTGVAIRFPKPSSPDEGHLPLPMGEVPRRGGEGVFYPLSHFVTAPPEWEPRGKRIATSAAGLLAMTCVIRRLPEYPGDCHTSDIGHWFAMTASILVLTGSQWQRLLECGNIKCGRPLVARRGFSQKNSVTLSSYVFWARPSGQRSRPPPGSQTD